MRLSIALSVVDTLRDRIGPFRIVVTSKTLQNDRSSTHRTR